MYDWMLPCLALPCLALPCLAWPGLAVQLALAAVVTEVERLIRHGQGKESTNPSATLHLLRWDRCERGTFVFRVD
jgi:hypothetical protein